MEALGCFLSRASSLGLIHGISLPNSGPVISHLMYADDVILMGEWSTSNAKCFARILRCFYLASGLRLNLSKCNLFGLNVQQPEISFAADLLHCGVGSLPFTYLGVPVGDNMNRTRSWQPVIDTFTSRLSRWKSNTLSFAGRITLIKSVLSSLPLYYFSLFKAPRSIIEKLDIIRRNFLWGGSRDRSKIHWVNWDLVTTRKEDGGLGIGDLGPMNLGLLSKWWWRYLKEPNALWCSVINALHGLPDTHSIIPIRSPFAGSWLNITRIHRLLILKGVNLHELFSNSNGIWQWNGSSDRLFSVKSVRTLCYNNRQLPIVKRFRWLNVVPTKVNAFLWKVLLNRIPTRDALEKRGVFLSSTLCPLCLDCIESSVHLFTSCIVVTILWHKISCWTSSPPIFAFSIQDLLEVHFGGSNTPRVMEAFQVIMRAAVWIIWKTRNEVVFNNKNWSINRIMEDVKATSLFWLNHRSKREAIQMDAWENFRF